MQKKMIALAIAGFASTGAFAQSNVTVYGQMDLGLRHQTSSSAPSVNGVGSMGSNLFGLKGSEDLGNGLTASFTLEGSISSDTGAGASVSTTGSKLFNRQSVLSLGSKTSGTLMIGRMNTFGRGAFNRASSSTFSNGDAAAVIAPAAGFSITGNGNDSDNTGARISNAIAYQSPQLFGSVTVGYAHAFAETTTGVNATTTNNPSFNLNQLWVGYSANGLNVDYVFNNIGAISTSTTANTLASIGGQQEQFIGAGYDFGTLKLVGSYQTRANNAGASTGTDKVTNIGLIVPVSASGRFNASYAQLTRASGNKTNTVNDANGWNLGYEHALSKRTKLYTTYVQVSNDAAGTLVAASGGAPYPAGTTNAKSSIFALGVAHTF